MKIVVTGELKPMNFLCFKEALSMVCTVAVNVAVISTVAVNEQKNQLFYTIKCNNSRFHINAFLFAELHPRRKETFTRIFFGNVKIFLGIPKFGQHSYWDP